MLLIQFPEPVNEEPVNEELVNEELASKEPASKEPASKELASEELVSERPITPPHSTTVTDISGQSVTIPFTPAYIKEVTQLVTMIKE
ncbi:MAG: hypothetical protein Q9167_008059, partial [Letrouitia subvulpina]